MNSASTAPQSSPASGSAAATQPRVVLMTSDGGTIDITDATGDLLLLARSTMQPQHSHAAGGAPCPPALAMLCQNLRRCDGRCSAAQAGSKPAAATADAIDPLTGRESQVVAHVRQGFTNKEIARRLGIQEDTVKKHLHAVFGKLGVRRRALLALRSGSVA